MLMTGVWRSAGRTDPGKVRARNEDAFLDTPERGLWVVADGMGGHQGGDIASRLIVDSLAELILSDDFDERVTQLRQCLHWLNRKLGQELTMLPDRADSIIGSTVVLLSVHGKRAVCIWAGDSRCYLWRGKRLYQLSRDHSLQQQYMDEQQMSAEQARRQPGAHALTRAVGVGPELKLEVLELEVSPGDAFLLCSDGLYHSISGEALGNALSLTLPRVALDRLFDKALRGKASDNLTAVVVRQ
ncbi:serine/threonine-protein phosphatase [Pseudomonas baltica]|jgi:serine/threonine-protein phosphatase Stp1|uniref:PP2C family protein-serine/threonine phosphatase n=1 Tax=Pseudomonas baltica TaxID=2762576 RepID=UPI0028990192|nr:serine/threonine-protein phosphatase [Pseudomonas baltica]